MGYGCPMSDTPSPLMSPSCCRPMRLQTLLVLRWMAVVGQSLGVLFVAFGLGFPLPLWECLVLIAISAALNIYLVVRFGPHVRLRPRIAAIQLAFDLCQLGGLLALTGGL